jgi:hypothetical protein
MYLRSRDVGGKDGSSRTRATEGDDVHAALGRESPCFRRCGTEARYRRNGGRRYLALDVGHDVGLLDPPGARLHQREVDAVLLGKLPGQGRGLDRQARSAARAR